MPVWDTFQKKMLRRYISASPLVVLLRATERAHQRAVQNLLLNQRELIVERTLAGLAAARAQGRIGGRRPKLTKEQHEQIARLIKNGHDRKQLAIIYDIGISTIYRYHPVGDIQAEETTRQTQENENR